jgi:hypothetical protein
LLISATSSRIMAISPEEVPAASRAQNVLVTFFSAPNSFVTPQAEITAGTRVAPAEIRPSLIRFAKGFTDRPLLLPFAVADEAETCWFACAHDELSGRVLRDEMMAFVGPSFADFEGDCFVLNETQGKAKAALSHAGLHVVAFLTRKTSHSQRNLQSWKRYWQLLDQRPPRPRQTLRTFSQLRAAFDRALVARNETDALAALAALRDQHGLSAENRAFLDIRLHAAFGRWDRILAHPQWEDILKIPLPPETYGDAWDALYETYLAEVEATGSARKLVGAFEDQVRVAAAPLLKSRGRSRRPAALKGFLLHELSLKEPSADLCASLLAQLGLNAFGPASEDLAAMAAALQRASGFQAAVHEMELERYEQAFALLTPLVDSIEVLRALLRCAKEIGDPADARSVLDRLDAATPETSVAVRESRARLIADVKMIAAQTVPQSLPEQIVECSTPTGADEVVTYWREFIQSPEAEIQITDPEFVKSLATSIEDSAVDDSSVFESLLPIWFDWLIVKSPPSSACVRVYQAFIAAIHARDRLGDSEREMVRLAARHALRAGLRADEYATMVDELRGLVPDSASPREVAWALDVADLLLAEPCKDIEARLRWLASAVALATQGWSRLSVAERCLAKAIAEESGIGLQIPSQDAEAEPIADPSFVNARICLYSLDALAISRAARVLADALPHAKIDTNSDEACTPRLRAGAKHADWVVFVSAVASHQAFYCIKNALRPDATLLQVEGSGTTRIVERVIRHAEMSPAQAAG